MPCNEEFFNSTGGRYGLSNKYIISNGAYSIDYYNTDTKTVVIQNNENVTLIFRETINQLMAGFNSIMNNGYLEDCELEREEGK